MAALKCQVPCLGVYAKVCNRDANGHPMWKHVDADLCIASAQVRAPVFAPSSPSLGALPPHHG